MPPAIDVTQLITKLSELLDSNDAPELTSELNAKSRLLPSESGTGLLGSSSEESQTADADKLINLFTTAKEYAWELINSEENSGPLIGANQIQLSSTLIPPECVTADLSNELLRKICENMTPDKNSKNGKRIH